MEIKEAIKILKGTIKKPNTKDGYLGQALTMGIEALENQQKENGHWNDSCPIVSDGSLWKSWVCSKCDNRVMVKTPYCCRCGAKMEGKQMNYEDIIAVLEWEDKCDKENKE